MDKKNYFIKAGYQTQDQSYTFDAISNKTYWLPFRLQNVNLFQYYVYQYASNLIKKHHFNSVLDIGSGPPAKLKQLIAPYCETVTLIDQASIESIVKELLPSANFIAANLETIDINLGTQFPVIICADVIEHLVDPDPCLNFIQKHLRNDGFAVISTPERDFLRGKDCMASPKKEHVREWNGAEFAEYIKSRGFEIVDHDFFPQKRQNALNFGLSRLIPMDLWRRSPALSKQWGGCQMVVGKCT